MEALPPDRRETCKAFVPRVYESDLRVTLVLGIDPSAAAPGYAVWCTDSARLIHAATEPPCFPCDVAVVESGWPHGKAGKVQMWGLGLDAGWRLCAAAAQDKYTIAPKAWRAALGGLPANAPKDVIVARLRMLRYKAYDASTWTDDVVEAAGIAEATAILLARPLKKNRTGLKEIKR